MEVSALAPFVVATSSIDCDAPVPPSTPDRFTRCVGGLR